MTIALLGGLAGLAFVMAVAVPIALYYAWAASYLWAWFIVPSFNAPPLSILQIWGICLTLSMLRPRLDLEKKNAEGWDGGLLALIIAPPTALGFGYAIKFWWM